MTTQNNVIVIDNKKYLSNQVSLKKQIYGLNASHYIIQLNKGQTYIVKETQLDTYESLYVFEGFSYHQFSFAQFQRESEIYIFASNNDSLSIIGITNNGVRLIQRFFDAKLVMIKDDLLYLIKDKSGMAIFSCQFGCVYLLDTNVPYIYHVNENIFLLAHRVTALETVGIYLSQVQLSPDGRITTNFIIYDSHERIQFVDQYDSQKILIFCKPTGSTIYDFNGTIKIVDMMTGVEITSFGVVKWVNNKEGIITYSTISGIYQLLPNLATTRIN